MKKLLFVLSAVVALTACGGEEKKPEGDKTAKTETTPPATPAIDEKSLELLATKGCTVCHGIDKKIIGPSYQDVAEKYKDAPAGIVDTLTQKVLKGGKGNWGEVAMTANENIVTPEEAKSLVTFILTLKK